MISHTLQFIFIHIPKTAGNSLSCFLQNYVANKVIQYDSNLGEKQGIKVICPKTDKCVKHVPIRYYYTMYPKKAKKYFKFTIVRNPYDRILSYYLWTITTINKDNKTFNREMFKKFINLSNDYQYKYVMYKQKIDCHIVHYENMMEEFKQIEQLKTFDFENYPKINSSENSKVRFQERYDKELQDLVYNKWKKDFESFGYSYEMPP